MILFKLIEFHVRKGKISTTQAFLLVTTSLCSYFFGSGDAHGALTAIHPFRLPFVPQ